MRIISKVAGRLILAGMRLRFVDEEPGREPGLIVGGPQTSYWDFAVILGIVWSAGYPLKVLIAHEFVRGPLAPVLRAIGCIPVDRSRPGGLVPVLLGQIREAKAAGRPFFLGIAPDGSRSAKPYWKSGFYRIAREADLRVTPGFVDSRTRTAGFKRSIGLTGDVHTDMAAIRAAFAGMQGLRPGGESQVRLREEDVPTA